MQRRQLAGAVLALIIATGALVGCSRPVPPPDPAGTADAVTADDERADDDDALSTEEWCATYAATLDSWSTPFQPIDEERFDTAIGVNFTGPAECYLARYSNGDAASRPTSVIAVFVCDDASIAEYMNQAMPLAGWVGSIANPNQGGRFSHPTLGDIGYAFNESAKATNIPLDDPAVVVTALLKP